MELCKSCGGSYLRCLLDVGLQPISNRFLTSSECEEDRFPFVVGCCEKCGLVQQLDPAPSEEVRPKFDWIKYNEPEGHLDDLVEVLIKLPGISFDSCFWGVTNKEDTTLARLSKKGYCHTFRLDLAEDLGVFDTGAGIETIQKVLDFNKAQSIAIAKGGADVVIARHILEHAHSPQLFIKALSALAKQDAYIVIEVPDNSKVLKAFDYSILWEEHILYFTTSTFLRMLDQAGCDVLFFKNYPYSMENSLVAVVRFRQDEKKIFLDYSKNFLLEKEKYQRILQHHHQSGPVAMLGAGHLAAHFISLMDVSDFIDFVVDDHPEKVGLFMPGSKIPILPTRTLLERGVKFCLMSVSAESEVRVMSGQKEYLAQGGHFYSIFPTSCYSLKELEK